MKTRTTVSPALRGLHRRIVRLAILLAVMAGFQGQANATEIFAESFDGGAGLPSGWAVYSNGNGIGWSLSSSTVDTPSYAMAVPESANNSDAWLTSPAILIPTPGCKLSFRHRYDTSYNYNRGWLEISIAGGSFNDLLNAGGVYLVNGYSPNYPSGWKGFTDEFITTEAYLPPAAVGQTIRLRWRFYVESSGGGTGWLVDTISISDGLTPTPDDISVTVSAMPNPVAIGGNLTYLIKLTNTGPSTATAVLVTNILPAGVTLVSSTISVGTCSNLGGTIVCGLGNLAGQSGATLTVVAEPTVNGLLTNRVTITRGEPDVYLLNNTASTVTLVAPPTLYPSGGMVVEGDSESGSVAITVSLRPISSQTVTVDYATANGSATADLDYSSRSGTLSFSPGESLKTVAVPILNDAFDESNETFLVEFTNSTNAELGLAEAVATIVDEDVPPYLVILDAMIVEGNSGLSDALFPIFLTAASGQTVSAVLYTDGGSASAPQDYSATNRTVVFPPGTTSQMFAVRVTGDRVPEPHEYFRLQMQTLVNASWFDSSAEGWIVNDDGLPGEVHHFSWSGITSPTFVGQPLNVTLTAKDYFNNTVTGFNSTVSLTATTLAAGGENGSFLNGPESDTYSYAETGGYAFTPNTNLVVTHVRHYDGSKISIWTDDGMLLASVPVTSVPGTWKETELPDPLPLAAGTTYRVGVYRNVPPLPYYPYLPYRFARPALFSHGVIGTAYHTYEDNFPTSSSSGIWLVDLRYLVGDPKTVSVTPTISGNFVNGVWPGAISVLENAANVRLLADDGQGRNGRSDPFDVLVLDDVWLNVSATPDPVGVGAPLAYLVTVTNSGPSAASGLVLTNYLPAGVAFVSASSSQGNTTFLAGNVIVCTLGALPAAAAATVTINVLVGEAGSITNLASVTRAEPDFTLVNNLATTVTTVRQPTLTVENASMVEGQVGTTPMVFNVRLSPASKETVTVNYVTADGSANSVDDYAGTGGTLSFAPGEMHHIVTVQVYGDGMNETNETVLLHFSQPTNAALVLTQAVGEILNDDPLPAVLIYGLSVNEGNVGSNTALFTVALTTASSRPVSVGYGVDNGTAQQPTDFVATHGVLVFPPGVTNQTIPVTINGDTSVENTETFTAYLNWTDNAFFANQQATGFIVNDDGLPGQLHHFNWAPIQTPQPAGQPFAVTITAQDYFENPASNFTGSVSLSAYQVTAEANGAILGSQVHSSSDNYGFYTLGYSFTPNADLLVTHVRHYFGSKVSVWTDDGSLLASQNVTSTPGTWEETPLSVPVWLSAGSAYRIGVYVGDGRRYWRSDGAPVFNHGAINQAWYGYQDSFPQGWDSARWWFVDLRYIVQTRQPVTLVPASTANFVAGLWTGVLAVSGSGNDVTLRADDNLGHFGLSEPFDVSGVRLDISRLGESVLLSWPTNTPGFFLESADDLSTPLTWKPVTNPPAIVGNQNVVTNTIPRSGGLFRLHNPGPP